MDAPQLSSVTFCPGLAFENTNNSISSRQSVLKRYLCKFGSSAETQSRLTIVEPDFTQAWIDFWSDIAKDSCLFNACFGHKSAPKGTLHIGSVKYCANFAYLLSDVKAFGTASLYCITAFTQSAAV